MSESLWPREHGAYAQLIFPVLSGLLLGSPGLESFGFGAAAILLFLAHEPVLVLQGVRGARRKREIGTAARKRLLLFLPAGLIAGAVAFALADASVRLLALIPGALAAAVVPLVLNRREKSIPGEILVAAAMASLHLPIGRSGGLAGLPLWGVAVLWFAFYVVATLAVHAIQSGQIGRGDGMRALSRVAALVALGTSIAMIGLPAYRWLGVAAAPSTLALAIVSLTSLSARRLKVLGWTLVAGQTIALSLLLLGAGRPG